MEPRDLIAIAFIIVVIIICAIYAQHQNAPTSARYTKQINQDSGSEATESEPELDAKEKMVDKMDLIPEENEKGIRRDDIKSDDLSDDSEEYSMQRMVEEYHKSRTLAKKVSEIIEDISDTFKRKSSEIKKKFEAPTPPAVVVPMSIKEKLAKINAQKSNVQQKKKSNAVVTKHKDKEKKTKKKQRNNDAVEIMDEIMNAVENEKGIEIGIQIGIEEEKVMEVEQSLNAEDVTRGAENV